MKLVLTGNEPRQKFLFAELGRVAEVLAELPFDQIDPFTKYVAAALSFDTPKREWWGNYQMHPLLQARRQKVLNRGLQQLRETPHALLMWGSWFNPRRSRSGGASFFNYIDQSRSLQPLDGEPVARFSRRRRSYEMQVETYRDSSGIFCMSEWCRNQTLEAHPAVDPKKVIAVGWGPCGVDLSAEAIRDDKPEPLVLHVSNDFQRKGVDFIVRTAAIVRSNMPQARFVVVGADSSGLQIAPTDAVEFTGRISDKAALADYFRRAALFFLPHRFDRSPHVLAEAMSAGLPIVTSAQGGPLEVTSGTGVGFSHTVGDVDAYAKSILQLLNDDTLRRSMAVRAKQLMLAQYNWNVVARRIVEEMARALQPATAR